MKRTIITRSLGLASLALAASMSLTACGDDSTATDEPTTGQSTTEAPMETPMESEAPEDAAQAQTIGASCSAIPTDPADPGSFRGMATEPVATAASANPLLTTLVSAVKKAGLVDTLNTADGITVFAPTNDAFAKIPAKDLKAVLKDKATLTAILTHHVVPGQLSPEDVAGTHDTLNNDQITVEGSGEEFTAEGAAVLCGNIPTANATVYVIDTVMMPAM